MTITKITLRDRLTMIAAEARLISIAATGLNENGTLGDGDLTGVVDLADRIERQLIEIADEIHHGEPDDENEPEGIVAPANEATREVHHEKAYDDYYRSFVRSRAQSRRRTQG